MKTFAMIIRYVYVETFHKVESNTTASTVPLISASCQMSLDGWHALEDTYLPYGAYIYRVGRYNVVLTMRMDGDDKFCDDYAMGVCRNIPQSGKQYQGVNCPDQRQVPIM